MNRFYILLIISLLFVYQGSYPQKTKTDANIVGHVVCGGKHIPFASIAIKGTTIGTVTDETGHYQLIDIPLGEITVVASMLGYKTQEKIISAEANKTKEIKFELEEDIHHLEEVVISGSRSEQKRVEAPVIINTISPKLFNTSQSLTLGEGLNYSPGLRLENNCQNCGFTQVRMNGMEGPYSQILINSRPVFSSLAGVYGMELIPVNMIEKVEVVRGGGSVLYGSNAIAGTINIILKDPVTNSYEAGVNYAFNGLGLNGSGGAAPDYSANLNTSMVSDDRKTGIVLYGSTRQRDMFDANNDGFSEIAPMNNLTMGTRLFHRFGYRGKLAVDFFAIKEQRDGGNKQNLPLHERDIAEAVKHDLKTGAVTYEQFFRQYDLLSIYASGQFLNRDSYYGANKSLSDYGNSKDKTVHIGVQYKATLGNSSLIAGIESTGGFLTDIKLGYPDYKNAVIINDSIVEVPHTENTTVADQSSFISGVFAQYEVKLRKVTIVPGVRYDYYKVQDHAKKSGETKTGNIFSPRISLMYEIFKELQARVSYSQGFRAPQIFDEDLHIETSGSRQVINVNEPDLKQETSHSVMASLDYNGLIGTVYTGFLIEGFFTRLKDPFVNEIGEIDENGIVLYTRKNAEDGATVQGINMEFKLKLLKSTSLTSGFTLQSGNYDVAQEFDNKRFFRTPNQYGYFAIDWDFNDDFCLSATGNYTGSMLVPYFGTETDPETGELRKSQNFFDMGMKFTYNVKLNGATLQWFAGLKNIFNAWQSDFDKGIDRDPSYMYGPVSPRTAYFGVKIANTMSYREVNTEVRKFPTRGRQFHRRRGRNNPNR
ncbi:MAG: TonB-dependent receptor [Bacteroidales bacterium]|nr:TonB-dependent receptor [Bacteroidales bacterium]